MQRFAYKEWRGCKRKKSYAKSAAVEIAKKLTKKSGEYLHAYKCDFCDFWHVGHPKYELPPEPEKKEEWLPPPDIVLCALYNENCDYCWLEIPHELTVHQGILDAIKQRKEDAIVASMLKNMNDKLTKIYEYFENEPLVLYKTKGGLRLVGAIYGEETQTVLSGKGGDVNECISKLHKAVLAHETSNGVSE